MVRPGLINLDFADVETVMSRMGKAMMGTGEAEGEKRAEQAAELAINNPLIDDYSLKGAKGLLINITGGKDLKLFEVDEAVNKVRAEVDPECELIIGAITDPALDGKLRVSIVATALDGQTPETKSVINMVHRIQNRNLGYSDFSSNHNSSVQMTTSVTNNTQGANALKLEPETYTHEQTITENLNPEIEKDSSLENISIENLGYMENAEQMQKDEEPTSLVENNLANEPEDRTPALFSEDENLDTFKDENKSLNQDFSDTLIDDDQNEEEDLEIPAFLGNKKINE